MQATQRESATETKRPTPRVDESPSPLAPSLETSAPPNPRRTFGGRLVSMAQTVACWFDNTKKEYTTNETDNPYGIDKLRMIPYLGMHAMCLGVIWVGWSPIAAIMAVGLYAVHMFSITAFYHRYFSHRSYKTSRAAQFVFAVMGSSCVQRGPIWWAARHRHHHRHSDEEIDVHSPVRHGLFWSHFGWIISKGAFKYDSKAVPDLMKFPELRFLDRFDNLVPVIEATALFFLGKFLQSRGWNTSGMQMLIWAFFISTVVCSHATFTINSLTHLWGTKRYKSKDESRNNLALALLTFGEGWHNNHHYYPGAVRQGFFWWDIDLTYSVLWLMARLGIIWELNAVPQKVRASHLLNQES